MTGMEMPAAATIMGGAKALGAANQMFGPQSPLITGDVAGAVQGAQAMMAPFSQAGAAAPKIGGEPTTMSKFGLSADEFRGLDPQIQQALLQKAMGR